MTQEQKDKWIEALRSGEYKQAQGALKVGFFDNTVGYCCLGVFCELNNISISENGKVMADDKDENYDTFVKILEESGNHRILMGDLISMNDEEENSFQEIADYIQKNIKTT